MKSKSLNYMHLQILSVLNVERAQGFILPHTRRSIKWSSSSYGCFTGVYKRYSMHLFKISQVYPFSRPVILEL